MAEAGIGENIFAGKQRFVKKGCHSNVRFTKTNPSYFYIIFEHTVAPFDY